MKLIKETPNEHHWPRQAVKSEGGSMRKKCPECGRVFDLLNETDAAEWAYGHDCEAKEEA